MRLVINGEDKEFSGISTLASLIAQMGLKADRLAVELNRDIVPRAKWSETNLKDGDRLEIVHFVGGGLPCECSWAKLKPLSIAGVLFRCARAGARLWAQ